MAAAIGLIVIIVSIVALLLGGPWVWWIVLVIGVCFLLPALLGG